MLIEAENLNDLASNMTVNTGHTDGLGRRIQVRDPDLGRWTYTYDDVGRLKTQTDAKGSVTALTYDVMGRELRDKLR